MLRELRALLVPPKPKPLPEHPGLRGLALWRARGGKPKPRSKAILMKEMADQIVRTMLGSKGRKLSREELLAAIDDDMLLAARAISKKLAAIGEDDDFSLGDTLQMFKQIREYQMAQARIQKIDPKDKDKPVDGTPVAFKNYQETIKEGAAQIDANPPPPAERVTAAGKRDKRHDNSGRPPGEGLRRRQEKVLREIEAARTTDAEGSK